MAKYKKRLEAHLLRKKGISIVEIAKTLGVSKSTVSEWCQQILLTDIQKNRLKQNTINAGNKGRMIGSEMNKRKKEQIQIESKQWAEDIVKDISKKELCLAAATLYWAEGSKSNSTSGFVFVNSDPEMIVFIAHFLKQISVKKDELFCTIQINKMHEPRIDKVLKFWQKLLDLPSNQIGKPYFIETKVSKVYDNYENYYGTCRLQVRKSSELKYKMIALIQAIKEAQMPV